MKEPLDSIRLWASEIRQGNFSARLPQTSKTKSEGLTDDINRLAEWLESLAEDQEAQILVQRSQLEQESGRVLRFEERTRLANELHDSLAQTLAGLKMQVRVLDDTLRQDNEAAIWQEMERIQAALDDANIHISEPMRQDKLSYADYSLEIKTSLNALIVPALITLTDITRAHIANYF